MSRTPASPPPPPDRSGPVPVVRTVPQLRAAVAALREAGRTVALVPTMGAFHDGHLSLMRLAGADGAAVVVSLFVNPIQFGAGEDLSAYPRDEARDLAMAAEAGAELVWAPGVEDVYPDGFSTTITVGGPSLPLEGERRPTHFAGVATVVAKLLTAVRPDRAVFGQKDAQQVAVIRRLVRDLHLDDVELVIGPVRREPDGLAMSSRNVYLSPEERAAAPVLRRSLDAAEALATEGVVDGAALEAAAMEVLASEPLCQPDYAALVDPGTFERLDALDRPALLCVAARVGPARLIDNTPLTVPTRRTPVPPRARTMLKSKIHRATVTEADLDYVGSITIDSDLLDLADIRPYEHVHVVDINNGARFETYAIEGPRGSGVICLNGAAARLVHVRDLIIVLSYAQYDDAELDGYEPIVVHVDEGNRPTSHFVTDTVPLGWEGD